MKHYDLPFEARQILGKELGINDANSPLLKSNEAFYDRAELIANTDKRIENLIEIFVEGISKYRMDSYILYLDKIEKALYEHLSKIIEAIDWVVSEKKKKMPITTNLRTNIYDKRYLDSQMVEITLHNKYYDTLKYMLGHITNLPEKLSEYIIELTSCGYYAIKDEIEIDKLTDFAQALLQASLDEISMSIMYGASNALNTNQLMYVGEGKVVYNVGNNFSEKTLESIKYEMNKAVGELLKNVQLDYKVYTLKEINNNTNAKAKMYTDGTYEVVGASEPEIIIGLRELSKSERTEYDRIFEVNGVYATMSR